VHALRAASSVQDVDVDSLQRSLRDAGAIVGEPHPPAPSPLSGEGE